jgi:hypothetical protein
MVCDSVESMVGRVPQRERGGKTGHRLVAVSVNFDEMVHVPLT